MRRITAVAVVAMLICSCDEITEQRPEHKAVRRVASPADLVLAVGDEVRVDSLFRLGFMSVPTDSRCPATVVCVRGGDGAAELAYGIGMGPSYPDTLHTALDPKQAEFAGYVVILVDLTPYLSPPGPIRQDQYKVRLRVERLSP